MKRFFVWAHRGASALAPENTLAAFRAAEAGGADGLELDVQLSRDGVPVVLHDATVDRTSDGRGAVAELTLTELRRLDVGTWFAPAFAGERLPTLEEVLAWGGRRLRFNIEIKDAAAGQAVLQQVRCHPRTAVLVSSFDHEATGVSAPYSAASGAGLSLSGDDLAGGDRTCGGLPGRELSPPLRHPLP
jgi:glycerophosphoryl diester phosphodiesterase